MQRKMDNKKIKLTDDQRKYLMNEIHDFFDEEFEDDIGMIKQQRILELFMDRLAPVIYNKALDDAIYWYKRQQDNLEADFYELYREDR